MDISNEQILSILNNGPAAGLSVTELSQALELPKSCRSALAELCQDLLRQGLLDRQGSRFAPLTSDKPSASRVTGVLQVTPKGRGFVDIGEAYDDVMIMDGYLANALDGDQVEVLTWQGSRRAEGEVVKVLQRGRTRVTGNLLRSEPDGDLVLELDDPRLSQLPLVLADPGEGAGGDAVLAEIRGFPEQTGDPLVVAVTRILGEPGNLVTEVARCVARRGVDEALPRAVVQDAAQVPAQVSDDELGRRTDLRDVHFVTIDPISARDFDDAVAVEDLDQGVMRVWVAIADVSHYVEEGSAIDLEARRRGCSIYLPDRAIHMLPESLSAGICSLVPNQDRLAMVTRFDLDSEGAISAEECFAAVIHSRGRLDYQGVAAAMEGDFRGRRARYQEHMEILDRLRRVATTLRGARLKRGSLDLDLPETQVVLDEDDPTRVRGMVLARPDRPIKQAYNVIEELMLAANEVVARRFTTSKQPAIWRIHPKPAADGLVRLVQWLDSYGLSFDPEKLARGGQMARLLRRIQDHRAGQQLSYLVLRTLKQAIYSTSNLGHFGLASKTYLHFTSPIRRYPDLQCHRLLKLLLAREGKPAGTVGQVRNQGRAALAEIAGEASACERRAIELEREVRSLYAAALMRDRIGDRHRGTVTGITNFGLFVSLDDPAVEGLVRTDTLPGRPRFWPDKLRLVDRGRGKVYSLGDRLPVEVSNISLARRQIELTLMEEGEQRHEADPGVDLQALLKSSPSRRKGKGKRKGGKGNEGSRRRGRGGRRGRRGR